MTRQIRSRLAGLRLPQHTLAGMLGISQTKLNLILNGSGNMKRDPMAT